MNNKTNLLACLCVAALLNGCSSSDSPFTEGGSSTGVPTDKNFNLFFSPVDPAVVDDDGYHGGIEVVVTAFAGDRNNAAVSGQTVYFQTEWGILNKSSCQLVKGSCSVTWTSDSDFGFIPDDLLNTFTAYTTGEESFTDLNGNRIFDDAESTYLRDLGEPFLDLDHNRVYTSGFDGIVDINKNGLYTPGDNHYNGAGCTHKTLCGATPKITIYDIGTISLDARTDVPVVWITSPTSGTSFPLGSIVDFTATAIDETDGRIIATDTTFAGGVPVSTPGVNIYWYSDFGILGTSTADNPGIDTSGWSLGYHTIYVTAVDTENNFSSAFIILNITP